MQGYTKMHLLLAGRFQVQWVGWVFGDRTSKKMLSYFTA